MVKLPIPGAKSQIPAELKLHRQWVNWKLTDDKRKIPITPAGRSASSTDSETWCEFDELADSFTGPGFVFTKHDPYVGIDLDGCRDATTGELAGWAQEIVERFSTYTEVSPSGTGVKLIGVSDSTWQLANKVHIDGEVGGKSSGIEVYDQGRYFTITADVVGELGSVNEVDDAINWLIDKYKFKPKDTRKQSEPQQERTDFDDRYEAARNAMRLVTVNGNENDGSRRMVQYARQAKRWGLYADEAVTMVRAILLERPLPEGVTWSDDAIKKRYDKSDAEFGEAVREQQNNAAVDFSKLAKNGQHGKASRSRKVRRFPCNVLVQKHPDRRPAVIDGFLRVGELLNIIGSPKIGKSWFIYYLCLCIATGRDWLGRAVKQGRVLLLDNELHAEELAYRIRCVAKAMGIDLNDVGDDFMVVTMRGDGVGIDAVEATVLDDLADQRFGLIVIDAFYRILPEGISENDNAQMTSVYNRLDSLARQADAPIALNHHTSKGDQSAKGVTDVGAGAGAMTRATDTHAIMRPHELEDCVVLEAVCRSNMRIDPMTLCFEWPLWGVKNIPPDLKQPKGSAKADQSELDQEADDLITAALEEKNKLTRRQIQTETGMGEVRTNRAIARLKAAGTVHEKWFRKKSGKKYLMFVLSEFLSAKSPCGQ